MISIHAPTRGATNGFMGVFYPKIISIHAPTRGATKLSNILQNSILFQSTLPRGERLAFVVPQDAQSIISIHAPTRGATTTSVNGKLSGLFQSTLPRGERQQNYSVVDSSSLFQSTLPRGERLCKNPLFTVTLVFQSTLPRGERLTTQMQISSNKHDFNPRSHEGSDR